jgi:hypothetical protein
MRQIIFDNRLRRREKCQQTFRPSANLRKVVVKGSGKNLHWRSNKINLDRNVRGAGGYTSTEGLLHSINTCNTDNSI